MRTQYVDDGFTCIYIHKYDWVRVTDVVGRA